MIRNVNARVLPAPTVKHSSSSFFLKKVNVMLISFIWMSYIFVVDNCLILYNSNIFPPSRIQSQFTRCELDPVQARRRTVVDRLNNFT